MRFPGTGTTAQQRGIPGERRETLTSSGLKTRHLVIHLDIGRHCFSSIHFIYFHWQVVWNVPDFLSLEDKCVTDGIPLALGNVGSGADCGELEDLPSFQSEYIHQLILCFTGKWAHSGRHCASSKKSDNHILEWKSC